MASIIMLVPKKSQYTSKFIAMIDDYIHQNGFRKLDNSPIIYFSEKTQPNQIVKNLISTIKQTEKYNIAISKLFYESNLKSA